MQALTEARIALCESVIRLKGKINGHKALRTIIGKEFAQLHARQAVEARDRYERRKQPRRHVEPIWDFKPNHLLHTPVRDDLSVMPKAPTLADLFDSAAKRKMHQNSAGQG